MEIDVAWDLNKVPWPWGDGDFDEIHAMSVLEHLDIDLVQSIDECWRILAPGGTLRVRLPYWQHELTWRDPTHRRGYTMSTFDLFDPSTTMGAEYGFYTERKWKIMEREYIYFKDDALTPSSVEATMRKL
jgi:SAM-dependent methyltransferase